GGTLATWNQPFEVARIQMQSAANEGKQRQTLFEVRKSQQRREEGDPFLAVVAVSARPQEQQRREMHRSVSPVQGVSTGDHAARRKEREAQEREEGDD
ncbi:hypothetical protein TGFOU_407260, partial [Toxoplasma gondii FOU]